MGGGIYKGLEVPDTSAHYKDMNEVDTKAAIGEIYQPFLHPHTHSGWLDKLHHHLPARHTHHHAENAEIPKHRIEIYLQPLKLGQ